MWQASRDMFELEVCFCQRAADSLLSSSLGVAALAARGGGEQGRD